MQCFARRRTDHDLSGAKGKLCGVETPSQVRYVHQLWAHLKRTECFLQSDKELQYCPQPTLQLMSLVLRDGFLATAHKMGKIKLLVQRQCGGGPGEKVLETPCYDPATTTEIPLDGLEIKGDVRVALFEVKRSDFDTQAAMAAAPNAYLAKGLVFMFLFHTHFVRLAEKKGDGSSAASKGALVGSKSPGATTSSMDTADASMQEYDVSVMNLDKAHKNVKRNKHPAGSGVVLYYRQLPKMRSPSDLGVHAWRLGAAPADAVGGEITF